MCIGVSVPKPWNIPTGAIVKVLVACEVSGTVRDAFARQGHDAWSCDLQEATGQHYTGDCRNYLDYGWDLLIAHPPCQYLSSSGLHWNSRVAGRAELTEAALLLVQELMSANVPRIAIENPVGCIGSRIRPASQYIQPYEYGHDASKKTGLWLTNLPLLVTTNYVAPRVVQGKLRWGNQTDSGQNRLGPSPTRAADRAVTYQGIADAMAHQWGNLPTKNI